METTRSGSIQTSPLGEGAVSGSGPLGPHRVLLHGSNRCEVVCSARPLAPPALNTGTLCPLDRDTPWESGSCPICEGRCVVTLCRHTCRPPLQDPSTCVCLQTHRSSLPSLTGGTESQSCGEQHRALWERTWKESMRHM